ncbi:unnamed protein product [Tuber melanosporum]|uniref:(Perigord truffle) hypothetical protein n=1 Tax=Tuber melanosporum (strain Mel28) TaxID=656061 RepID=D5GPZ8_TUBMM|nr:uncharacterized protein GSTUM_00012112001 [Tuber melanosporum]CAZ86591.1 unnamed protein product [Tuber melanosporum]
MHGGAKLVKRVVEYSTSTVRIMREAEEFLENPEHDLNADTLTREDSKQPLPWLKPSNSKLRSLSCSPSSLILYTRIRRFSFEN